MMSQPSDGETHQRMIIRGELHAATFLPWIRRHAARLGLHQTIAHADDQQIELEVRGPEELVDMMEVGCLLGPIDTWVETIDRRPVGVRHILS
jgi:acylphosphatase